MSMDYEVELMPTEPNARAAWLERKLCAVVSETARVRAHAVRLRGLLAEFVSHARADAQLFERTDPAEVRVACQDLIDRGATALAETVSVTGRS